MSREVIEREGIIDRTDGSGPVWRCAHANADARWAWGRVKELARTDPPHLVEEPLSVTAHLPGADGRRRYFVRAVMNTEKGYRLLVSGGPNTPEVSW